MAYLKFSRVSKFCKRFFLLVLLATTVWQTIMFVLPRSQATPATVIAVSPVENVFDPGQTFSVNITIAGVGLDVVTDVYSYEVRLGFDKNVITPVYQTALVMEGPYLRTYAEENFFQPPIPTVKFDNPNYVYFADALFGGSVPGCPTENGVLFTVQFRVLAAGVSTLNVFGSIIVSYDPTPPGTMTPHYPPDDFTESDGSLHTNYPVAAFSFSPNTFGRPIVGENVTFDASASFDPAPGGFITSYEWNFNDTSPLGYGMIVKHVYVNASSLTKPYNVTLKVTNNAGLSTLTYKKNANEMLAVKRHDIAITDFTRITTGDIFVRQDVKFNVTVVNNGSHLDTFNVTSYINSRPFNTTKVVPGLAPGEEKNITITLKTFVNETTVLPTQKGSGSGWTVGDDNASISDDVYSFSSTNQSSQTFLTYKGFSSIGWDGIAKIEVGLEMHTDAGGDDQISVQVFSGLGWTNATVLNVTSTSDTMTWVDITNLQTWLPVLMEQNRLAVKLTYIQVGSEHTPIYVDYLPIRITPTNPRDLPAGSYDLWSSAYLIEPSLPFDYRGGEEPYLANNTCYGEPLVLTIVPVHDVAVTEVKVTPTSVAFGSTSSVQVKVKNFGNLEELVDVTVYANSTVAGSLTKVNILAGATRTFNFNWYTASNTTIEGMYNITATVSWIVNGTGYPLEGDLTNNVMTKMFLMRLLPVAYFNYSPATPNIDQAVTFVASGSYAPGVPGGSIQSYTWDFGDGTTGTGATVSHTYTSPGSKSVKLTVSDNENLNFTLSKTIAVPKLVSTITLSSSSLVVPLSLNTTLSGGISPVRADATVAIQLFKPAADTVWDTLSNVTTNVQGAYSFVWVPTELGKFTFRVKWMGDNNTMDATSVSLNVTVTRQDTSVLSVVPSKYIVAWGDTLPIDVTVANNGTAAETVTLSVYVNNTLIVTKVLTGVAAGASQKVRVNMETENLTQGIYVVKAVMVALPGEKSVQDNSRTIAVFVQEEQGVIPPQEGTSIFMYATIGLAIALVAVVAFFFFKMRKPTAATATT